jgi:predicted Zn-dependent protease
LIQAVRPTDDELAVVMGHEIAHALLSHQAEGASTSVLTGLGMSAVCVATPSLCAGAAGQLTGAIAELGILMPHGRSQETEADEVGLRLSAQAGYDPRAAVKLWQKMAQAGGANVPEFLSTHPSPENRQAHLAQLAEQLMPVYETARRGR